MDNNNKKYFYIETQKNGVEVVHMTSKELNKYCNENGLSSRGVGYDRLEEFKLKEGILEDNCKICNCVVKTTFAEPVKSELIKKNICFGCNFWLEIENSINNPILLVQSPFGIYWQILGAWDKELVLLEEL